MSPKAIIISLLVVLALVVSFAFIFTGGKTTPAAVNFSSQDADRPRAETGQTLFDLGEMKVSDTKQQDFTLKNTGSKPLQILNINSSCNCTFGQIIYRDLTSAEYGMHKQSGFVTEIAPGDTAIVRLTYKPAIMPVYGTVEREVYVSTNDPSQSKLVFQIKAVVK